MGGLVTDPAGRPRPEEWVDLIGSFDFFATLGKGRDSCVLAHGTHHCIHVSLHTAEHTQLHTTQHTLVPSLPLGLGVLAVMAILSALFVAFSPMMGPGAKGRAETAERVVRVVMMKRGRFWGRME